MLAAPGDYQNRPGIFQSQASRSGAVAEAGNHDQADERGTSALVRLTKH